MLPHNESGSCDISLLPSLVLLRVIRLLSPSYTDVKALSLVNRRLRDRVMADLALVYHPRLHLDNGHQSTEDFRSMISKPVLSLSLTCSTPLEATCSCRCLDPQKPPCSTCPQINSHSHLLTLLPRLDLSNLRSLHLNNLRGGNRKAYHGLWKVLPLNPTIDLRQLEFLSVDIPLINLSEIRDAIINVVYQHDDFANKETNLDYIINSAVSQVLYTFLMFVDDLNNGPSGHYSDQGLEQLKCLELCFLTEAECDWSHLDLESLTRSEIGQLRNCIEFMVNEFKNRFTLNFGITESITIRGIPGIFFCDLVELTNEVVEDITKLWPTVQNLKAFQISSVKRDKFFDLDIRSTSI